MSEWKIENGSASLPSIKNIIDLGMDTNLIPLGITSWDIDSWVLMANIPEIKISSWKIIQYELDDDAVKDGIDSAVESDWTPWGLMIRWGFVYILYIKRV